MLDSFPRGEAKRWEAKLLAFPEGKVPPIGSG